MTGLAMIERTLASANDRVRSGLQVQIRFRSHRFDNVHNRRKTRGGIPRFRKLCQFDVLRPSSQQHCFAEKLTRARSIGESHFELSGRRFLERAGVVASLLFTIAVDAWRRARST